jgi:uncharacterized protein with PIN domain
MIIISDLQEAAKVLKKAGKIELYHKFLVIQEKVLEVMQKNEDLRHEVDNLKKALKVKGSIVFEKQVYWLKDEEKNKIEGPFCPKCYDDEKLLMHLIESELDPKIKRCPRCRFTRMKL